MEKLFLRHPHLDLTSKIVRGTERLFGGGSYADVYKAALQTEPEATLVAGSNLVNGVGYTLQPTPESSLVAMKRFRIHLTGMGDVEKMIVREFSIWAQVHHKNVLPLLGYCTYNGAPTMISPWMEDGSILDYWIANDGRPGSRAFVDIVVDIANGLEYLHSEGIVHCDLKCGNILSSPSGVPLIADFGISRLPSGTMTCTTNVKGTMRWMAVELIFSPRLDPSDLNSPPSSHTKSTDVWAFGMTVLELWTKEPPYGNIHTDGFVVVAIAQGTLPPPPSDAAATLAHQSLWNMCRKCWSQTPRDRPLMQANWKALQHVQENPTLPWLVDDVNMLLDGQSVPARTPAPIELTPTADAPLEPAAVAPSPVVLQVSDQLAPSLSGSASAIPPVAAPMHSPTPALPVATNQEPSPSTVTQESQSRQLFKIVRETNRIAKQLEGGKNDFDQVERRLRRAVKSFRF